MSAKIAVTSLGCAKNLVDSEVIQGYLREGGYEVCGDLDEARVIIVNTCSFIRDAEEESEDTIDELLALKEKGGLDHVIVTGCLIGRRGRRLARRFPGVDLFLQPGEIPRVAQLVGELTSGEDGRARFRRQAEGDKGWFLYDHLSPRLKLSPPHYAYVKIGEGCGNACSYCLIPAIKGGLVSREMDSVVAEVKALAAEGVREINLISQDTTSYGLDLYGKPRLAELLKKLVDIEGVTWIRILYGHPAHYTDDVLRCIESEPRICAYVDFPLQHVAGPILASMNRRMTKKAAVKALGLVRKIVPNVTVRTTFIVGYPGETEAHFRELLQFVEEARFEHLGAFIYSREKGTAAASLPAQVPHGVKRERFHRLMTLQQEIVRAANERMNGKVARVMVDEELHEGSFDFKGRTEGDAPEVDGTVYFSGKGARPGDLVDVRVTGAMEYDLVGEMINS
jgi:ribosomal protein S12 methylthiotransferase